MWLSARVDQQAAGRLDAAVRRALAAIADHWGDHALAVLVRTEAVWTMHDTMGR